MTRDQWSKLRRRSDALQPKADLSAELRLEYTAIRELILRYADQQPTDEPVPIPAIIRI